MGIWRVKHKGKIYTRAFRETFRTQKQALKHYNTYAYLPSKASKVIVQNPKTKRFVVYSRGKK
jgi:hypothetical protein